MVQSIITQITKKPLEGTRHTLIKVKVNGRWSTVHVALFAECNFPSIESLLIQELIDSTRRVSNRLAESTREQFGQKTYLTRQVISQTRRVYTNTPMIKRFKIIPPIQIVDLGP